MEQDQPVFAREQVEVQHGQAQAIEQKLRLEARFNSGASWFYWIAVLSVVNSIIAIVSGGGWSFIFGLGVTQIIDAIGAQLGEDYGNVPKIIAFVMSLIAAGVFILFGFLAKKRLLPGFIIGMVLYLLDGLLFLLAKDIFSLAFHAYALFSMWGGLQACRQLRKIEAFDHERYQQFTPQMQQPVYQDPTIPMADLRPEDLDGNY